MLSKLIDIETGEATDVNTRTMTFEQFRSSIDFEVEDQHDEEVIKELYEELTSSEYRHFCRLLNYVGIRLETA